jgi:hypothetical protein
VSVGSASGTVGASTGGVNGAHPQNTHSPGVCGGHVTEYPGGQGGHRGVVQGGDVLDGVGVRVMLHGGVVNQFSSSRNPAYAERARENAKRIGRCGYCFGIMVGEIEG